MAALLDAGFIQLQVQISGRRLALKEIFKTKTEIAFRNVQWHDVAYLRHGSDAHSVQSVSYAVMRVCVFRPGAVNRQILKLSRKKGDWAAQAVNRRGLSSQMISQQASRFDK